MLKKPNAYSCIRILLFAVYLLNGIFYIPKQAVLPDEGDHLNYAFRILKGQPEKVKPYDDASTMPISVLNTLPRVVEQVIHSGLQKKDNGEADIINGRYVTWLVSLLIGVFIVKWSKELYGERAATFALFLFVFCPNLNAHAGFVATDAYAALFTIAPCYYFWKFHKTESGKHLILFSISLGLAQLTKQSLTNLFIIFFLLATILQLKDGSLFRNIKAKIGRVLVVVFITLGVINAGFLFHGSFMCLEEYDFKSNSFNDLRSSLTLFKKVPLPFPSPYIEGLDLVKHMTELNPGDLRVSYGNYALGELRREGSFWYYYFIILLFKSPLLLIVGAFVLLFCRRRLYHKDFMRNEFIILFVIVYFFIFFNFLVSRQAGIRHILVIYPLLYVLMARLVTLFANDSRAKLLAGAVALYSISTFYYFFPNLVAYTNELLTDKKKAYTIMADSNLDWGQGQLYLKKYLRENPDVKLPASKPGYGKYIMSVNDFVGLSGNKDIEWIRKFKPADHVYFSYLLFNISQQDIHRNFK